MIPAILTFLIVISFSILIGCTEPTSMENPIIVVVPVESKPWKMSEGCCDTKFPINVDVEYIEKEELSK